MSFLVVVIMTVVMVMRVGVIVCVAHFAWEWISLGNFAVADGKLHSEFIRKRQKLRRGDIERFARLEMLKGDFGDVAAPSDLYVVTRMRFSGFLRLEHH